jgi:hypothetical protein
MWKFLQKLICSPNVRMRLSPLRFGEYCLFTSNDSTSVGFRFPNLSRLCLLCEAFYQGSYGKQVPVSELVAALPPAQQVSQYGRAEASNRRRWGAWRSGWMALD